jgi:hypothetical protein
VNKKTEIELRRDDTIDLYRTLIRLKHRRRAAHELNDILPDTLNAFDAAVQAGNLKLLESVTIDLNDITENNK